MNRLPGYLRRLAVGAADLDNPFWLVIACALLLVVHVLGVLIGALLVVSFMGGTFGDLAGVLTAVAIVGLFTRWVLRRVDREENPS